jgi:hypothetical protein
MRPQFVLFGSSIVQYSYYEGWGATLSHLYARKVLFPHLKTLLVIYKSEYIFSDEFPPPFEMKELGSLSQKIELGSLLLKNATIIRLLSW